MVTIAQTPYEEQDAEEEAIHTQTRFIRCPYCHAGNDDQLIDDYYTEKPPMDKYFTIHWICDNCQSSYITTHELDNEGIIIPPEPAVEVII
jgi:uncharacterized protein with PIN domain